MSWTDLDPIVKTVPNVKASVVINNDGITRVNISFSEPFYREIGEPTSCDVQAGTGENVGKIRLAFKPKGRHGIRVIAYGGARLQIRAPEGVPARVRDLETAEVIEKSKDAVILTLPMEAWAKQGQTAPKQTPEKSAPPKNPSATPPAAQNLPKLDAVDYLSAKGVRISRHGAGFKIDGSIETRAGTLTIINRHRRAAGLEPLGMDDFT